MGHIFINYTIPEKLTRYLNRICALCYNKADKAGDEMKLFELKRPMSETFLVGALLTIVGGYFDAYTYITRGKVFANAQTGNIVLLGINLAEGDFLKAVTYLIPVLAFVLGIFTAELIHKTERHLPIHWRQSVIALEIITVIVVAFLPTDGKGLDPYNMTANVIISYVCSLQVQTFRKIHGITCATTMCTGNLRSGTDLLMKYQTEKKRQYLYDGLKYYAVNLIFVAGAFISVFLSKEFQGMAVIFCLLPLVIVFALMFVKQKEIEKKENGK